MGQLKVPRGLLVGLAVVAVVSYTLSVYLEVAQIAWLAAHPIHVNLLSGVVGFSTAFLVVSIGFRWLASRLLSNDQILLASGPILAVEERFAGIASNLLPYIQQSNSTMWISYDGPVKFGFWVVASGISPPTHFDHMSRAELSRTLDAISMDIGGALRETVSFFRAISPDPTDEGRAAGIRAQWEEQRLILDRIVAPVLERIVSPDGTVATRQREDLPDLHELHRCWMRMLMTLFETAQFVEQDKRFVLFRQYRYVPKPRLAKKAQA